MTRDFYLSAIASVLEAYCPTLDSHTVPAHTQLGSNILICGLNLHEYNIYFFNAFERAHVRTPARTQHSQ